MDFRNVGFSSVNRLVDEYYTTDNLPAEQTSLEQGLSRLQLGDSDESERNESSFDSDSADRLRGSFSSGRHSLDMSQSSSDYSAGSLRSSLGDNGYGSMRYSTSGNSSSARHSRASLLRAASKIVSGGMRAIGLKSKVKASVTCDDEVIVSSQLHIYAAKKPVPVANPDDEKLIEELRSSSRCRPEHPVHLRRLSRALVNGNRAPFARRLDDYSLDDVARELGRNVLTALNTLRKLKGIPVGPLQGPNPSADLNSEDAELIEWFAGQFTNDDPRRAPYASSLRALSRALAENELRPFAGRLEDSALDAVAGKLHDKVGTALNALREMKGVAVARGRAVAPEFYSQDKHLIQRFHRAYKDGLAEGLSEDTARSYSILLRKLSRWCFDNNRGAIADRLDEPSLLIEAEALGKAQGEPHRYTQAVRALFSFLGLSDFILQARAAADYGLAQTIGWVTSISRQISISCGRSCRESIRLSLARRGSLAQS